MRSLNSAKIDKKKLVLILRERKMTQKQFASLAGQNSSLFSQVASPKKTNFRYSQARCEKILENLGGEYKFDDLFYWTN